MTIGGNLPVESSIGPGSGGYMSPQTLIEAYYKRSHPNVVSVGTLFSVDALKQGREKHNAYWFLREIVQNFVDANPGDNKHTLNGVKVNVTKIAGRKRRIHIQAPWSISSADEFMAIATGKAGQPMTAGGKGLGLKETSRDLSLDHGVSKCMVQGGDGDRGWSVTYKIVKPEDVNPSLGQIGASNKLTSAYIVAEYRNITAHDFAKIKGTCSYTFETDNDDIVKAFSQFMDYGAHAEHPALQNMDYPETGTISQTGSIKWLDLNKRGWLFVNGQPWSYQDNKEPQDGYFQGAQGATVQVNTRAELVKGEDRLPLNQYDFQHCIEELVAGMSKDDLIKQLKASFNIWGTNLEKFSFDREGCFVLIEAIVTSLGQAKHGFTYKELQAHFAKKNFISVDYETSAEDIEALRKQDIIVCPSYFRYLKVPKFKKDVRLAARDRKPDALIMQTIRQLAAKKGIPIFGESIKVENTREFFELLKTRLGNKFLEVTKSDGNNYQIMFRGEIPSSLLIKQFLGDIQNDKDTAALLHSLRGCIFHGLNNGIFREASTSIHGFVSTYDVQDDDGNPTLVVRNTQASRDIGITAPQLLEFKLDPSSARIFESVFIKRGDDEEITESTITKQRNLKKLVALPAAAVGLLCLVAASLIMHNNGTQTDHQAPGISNNQQDDYNQPEIVAIDTSEEERALDEFGRELPEDDFQRQNNANEYKLWQEAKRYGQFDPYAEYSKGISLTSFADEFNSADIDPRDKKSSENDEAIKRLKSQLAQLEGPEHAVQDLEILKIINPNQEKQIELLREFVHLATGIELKHDFFIFKGKGSKGLNARKGEAIGLHAALFDEDFVKALEVYVHELAHNMGNHSDPGFYNTAQAIYGGTIGKLIAIADTPAAERTRKEERLLVIAEEWKQSVVTSVR